MKQLILCLALMYLVTTISVNCYRLPTSVVPQHYTVNILTELDNDFYFNGDVLIKIDCLEPTTNITLHSKNLDVPKETVSLKTSDNAEVKISNVRHDDENDFLIIFLESSLAKGSQYSLYMKFSGILSEGLAGYYRSSYVDRTTGIKKWVAVTQFESTDARRAFPCFDEPGMKAVFRMSLGHKNNYTSISNMRIKSVEKIADKPDWVIDHYEDTVKMSTYLVAFVVSDFAYKISEQDNSGHWKTGYTNTAYDDTEKVRVARSGGKCRTIKRSLANETQKTPVMFRTWARKDALNQVDYAADNGPKYLKFYEEFFNVSYPLPKQDMIALPDFSAGAMENWGLITYRETALLYDPKASSVTSKHRVAEVIAHELAHQWFGNLVTMKWWTDLWLNEGFATYMESLAVDYVNPKWNSLPEEATDYLLSVFSLDALNSSHPISIPIGHPNEISQIFDTISYRKGASILRMMNLFLGDSVFKKGVSNYLNKYAYGNAEQDNLWECLTEEAHKQNVLEKSVTVKEIMDTWTLQTGHPVVSAVRDYDKEEVTLTQKRFFTDTTLDNGSDKSCWWVPLSFTTSEEKDFNTTMAKDWLKCGEEKVLCSEKNDEWYMVNIKLAGLYRVNYDMRNWQALTKVLVEGNHKDIAVLNRVQLIVDSLDLAATGHVNYSVPLNLLKYLEKETEYLPWSTALSASGHLNRRLLKTPAYGAFKKYVKQLLTPIYEQVGGFDMSKLGDTEEISLIKFKIKVTATSCSHDIGSCRKNAQELFSKWKGTPNPDNDNPIPKDLRGVVYCVALKDGNEDDWEFLWKRYVNSNVAAEKASMLSSLGCTSKLWLLNRYLEWSITDGTEIRKQDSFYVFGAVANNEVGYYLAKDFLKNRLEDIYSYHGAKSGRMTRYFSGIAPHMMSTSELNEFIEITHRNETIFNESKLGIHQAMETIRINIQWHTNYYQDVKNLLENLVKQ